MRHGRIEGATNVKPAKTGEQRRYCELTTCNKRRYVSTMVVQKGMFGSSQYFCSNTCHNQFTAIKKKEQERALKIQKLWKEEYRRRSKFQTMIDKM